MSGSLKLSVRLLGLSNGQVSNELRQEDSESPSMLFRSSFSGPSLLFFVNVNTAYVLVKGLTLLYCLKIKQFLIPTFFWVNTNIVIISLLEICQVHTMGNYLLLRRRLKSVVSSFIVSFPFDCLVEVTLCFHFGSLTK